jgi:heme/copper-type cytochrome/quinol oxidase subunit 2
MLLMMGRLYAGANAMPEGVPLAAISERYAFLLTVMGRAVVLFTIFFLWAYRTRLNDSDTHKRMMFLATWATIDAAIARIPGSFELGAALGLRDIGLTSRDDIPHFWMLVTLVPAMLYDLIRRKRIHSAWLTGIVIFLVFAIPAHFLEAAPQWWQDIIGNVTGRS